MKYISYYSSPLGEILLAADEIGLTGLWFENQKFYGCGLEKLAVQKETESIKKAKQWLDEYFSGIEPDFSVPLHFIGTDFQIEVWNILCKIPYGKTNSYDEIARIISRKREALLSPQAVGSAVARNKISIIVPCHRVVGTDGSLKGYAGGLDRKSFLLELEKNSCR